MSSSSEPPKYHVKKLAVKSTPIELPKPIVTLAALLTATYRTYAHDFETKFAAWKHACISLEHYLTQFPIPHTSDSTTTSPKPPRDIPGIKLITATNDIHSLGPGTIPFLLTHFQESFSPCDLYHALQTDATLLKPSMKGAPDAETRQWILKHYAALLAEFAHLVHAWQHHQARHVFPCCTFNAPSYRDLVAMGHAIVPLIMAEYAEDQRGPWHELLFEIVNGRPSGAMFYGSGEMFRFWKGWFEGGRTGRGQGGGGGGGEVMPPYVDEWLNSGKGGPLDGVGGDAGFGEWKAELWEGRCGHHACCGGGL